MNLFKSTVIASAISAALAASAGAAPLFNGDFELPVTPGAYLSVGSTIPGWTVVGTGAVNVDHVTSGTSYWLGNATQFMDLTGSTGGAGIQSDAFATTIGQTYEITFAAFNGSLVYPGTAYTGPVLSLQASGSSAANYNGTTDMPAGVNVLLSYAFTAIAANTTLTFMDTSGFDSNGGWIDNVTIQPVPEPSTSMIFLGALCVPLAAKFLRMRSKQRAA